MPRLGGLYTELLGSITQMQRLSFGENEAHLLECKLSRRGRRVGTAEKLTCLISAPGQASLCDDAERARVCSDPRLHDGGRWPAIVKFHRMPWMQTE